MINKIPDIIKYAAVILNEKKQFLIVKDFKDDFWKNVGGKPDGSETPAECITREVKEELGVEVTETPEYYFSCPITPTASDPNKTVQIILYFVKYKGNIIASSEIEKVHWLSLDDFSNKKFNLSPQLTAYIVPKLIEDKRLA